ncbi:MAG: cell division protein SepF [Massiliimalia sp.]|jgi:cell division inhibitor SepF
MIAAEQQNTTIYPYPTAKAGVATILLTTPSSFSEVREIADALKEGKSILLNLERADADTIHRMTDFFRGFIYAIDGNMERMSHTLIIMSPPGVSISGEVGQPLDDQPDQ